MYVGTQIFLKVVEDFYFLNAVTLIMKPIASIEIKVRLKFHKKNYDFTYYWRTWDLIGNLHSGI